MITTFDIEFADRFIPTFCQISIQSWDFNKCVDNYTTILSPQSDIEDFMTNRHGIRSVDTAGKPTINMIWDQIYNRLNGEVVFMHNAYSVITSLKKAAKIERLNFPSFYYVCTKQLSKKVWKEFIDYKLITISEELGFADKNFDAENDAQKIKKILDFAMNKLGAQNLNHLNDLIELPIGFVDNNNIITPSNIDKKDKVDIIKDTTYNL